MGGEEGFGKLEIVELIGQIVKSIQSQFYSWKSLPSVVKNSHDIIGYQFMEMPDIHGRKISVDGMSMVGMQDSYD